VSGPIYTESDTKRIGKTGVRVPSAFFKVIIAPYLDTPRGIGFIYPNMTSPGNMQNYSMTIDEVEKITGFDFFYNLPDEIESAVESKASFKEWNTSK
jgi:endonuclease G